MQGPNQRMRDLHGPQLSSPTKLKRRRLSPTRSHEKIDLRLHALAHSRGLLLRFRQLGRGLAIPGIQKDNRAFPRREELGLRPLGRALAGVGHNHLGIAAVGVGLSPLGRAVVCELLNLVGLGFLVGVGLVGVGLALLGPGLGWLRSWRGTT